jgi:hypothetical protein
MLILRSSDSKGNYVNQSGERIRKTGMLRIRAMEHLRCLFTTLSKRGHMREQTCLNDTMRKKLVETLLHMMRTYQFCSISHQ